MPVSLGAAGGWVSAAVMISPKLRFSVLSGTCTACSPLRHQSRGTLSANLPRRTVKFSAVFGGVDGFQAGHGYGQINFRNSAVKYAHKLGCTVASGSQDCSDIWTGEIGEVEKSSQRKTNLQVVLVSPQIPGNTGCIARSCAAAAVGLHLVEPLGFEIDSAKLKRAGLDYWPYVVVKVHKSWVDFFEYFQQQEGEKRLLAFTKKGNLCHTDVRYKPGDWLVFGSETDGLPDAAVEECLDDRHGGGLVRIPIDETYVRCLNLSVAAGIGVYEALRQLGYRENMLESPERDSTTTMMREDIFC